MIAEIPLYVLRMIRMYSPPITRPIGVTSHTTPLSIRRGVGGEASVNSVCRRHSVGSKRAQKGSVNSVRSVRDKTPHDSYWQAYRGNLTFHSPPYGGGVGGGAGRSGGEAGSFFYFPPLLFKKINRIFAEKIPLARCRDSNVKDRKDGRGAGN